MDSFFLVPLILSVVSLAIFCSCFCVCLYLAKKQGRFPTVNRNGPGLHRVNRSGPAFGANRSAFGSGVTRNTTPYNEMVNDDPPFGFATNTLNIQNNLTNLTDNDTTVNTYGWSTTHTTVNELPPSYAEATGISTGSRHESQSGHCDIGFQSDIVKDSSGDTGKCYSGNGGTTYDSGGGGDSGTCDSGGGGGGDSGGGETGGCDSGGGGGDTTTD